MTTNFRINAGTALELWGDNSTGVLGNLTNVNSESPVEPISGGRNWLDVCGSTNNTGMFVLALKNDNTLWSWGTNTNGALGDGTNVNKSSPVQVIGNSTDWKLIAAGDTHSMALKTDNTLWLWGGNASGQLGNSNGSITSVSSPIQTISGGNTWRTIAAGASVSASIKSDGTLWLWGSGISTGSNNITNRSSPVQTVSGGTNWKKISIGQVVAAIKTDGTLWTWGSNNQGQLGDGTITNRSSPVQTLALGTDWVDVAATAQNAAHAIKSDGTLWVWGAGTGGRLGTADLIHRSSPVQTAVGGNNWELVTAGYYHVISTKTDGTFWGWGGDNSGQLGPGATNASSPIQLYGNTRDYISIKAFGLSTAGLKKTGIDFDDLFVRKDPFIAGGLWSWGDNAAGTLGDGTNSNHRSSPVQTLAGGTPWRLVIGGRYVTLAIRDNGSLWGWGGTQSYGELGDTTRVPKSSPIQIIPSSANTWTQVTAGWGHVAAVKTDNTLWTWGNNDSGQLGQNNITHRSSPAQVLGSTSDWKLVSAGATHTMAIKTDGTLWMWGTNGSRELGNFNFFPVSSPVQTVFGGNNWKYISGGFNFSTAIKNDDSLWVWGRGSSGQLGLGEAVLKSSPVQLSVGWRVVAAAKYHTLGIKTDGTLWTWGHNATGALGDGTITHRSSPVQTLAGGANWKTAAGSAYISAAIKTDGTLWVWGHNDTGQLARADRVHRSSPVQTISGGTLWKSVHCGDEFMLTIQEDYF